MAWLKTELQSYGVQFQSGVLNGRSGGAGPAEGIILMVRDMIASVPAFSKYVAESPFRLAAESGQWFLARGEESLAVEVGDFGEFHRKQIKSGRSFSEIALIHADRCLGSTVNQSCAFWGTKARCKFCGIELSVQNGMTEIKKQPDDLAFVARAAEEFGVEHVVLTSGSSQDGAQEIRFLAECVYAIKQATSLHIQAQCRPPQDLTLLEILKESGVDTVAINIESFDWRLLRDIAPNKAELGMSKYVSTWNKAIELFGKNQVITFALVGLGETDESIFAGSELAAAIGVYPFLVPFRPIPNSLLQESRPPSPQRMKNIYLEVAKILKKAEISSQKIKAGCGRCTACSALPDFEQYG